MELGFHPFCYQSPSAFITSSALLTSPGHCHRWPSCPARPLPASEPALKQKHTLVCCLSMARLCRSLHHHQVRGSQRDRGWVSWDRLWVIPQERIRNILQLGFLLDYLSFPHRQLALKKLTLPLSPGLHSHHN